MAAPTSRDTLIEHCKRRLGDPVIEINVDDDQVSDRVDEALQYYQEFHSDATHRTYLKHLVTGADVANEYITLASTIQFVSRLFPIASAFGYSHNFFDIKYQMMLNNIADLQNFAGDLAYYEQLQQYFIKLYGNDSLELKKYKKINFLLKISGIWDSDETKDFGLTFRFFIFNNLFEDVPKSHIFGQ